LAPIAPPVSTTPASQKVISEYSPIIMLDVNSANKIFRPQMSSWSGDQIWTISSLPASSYQSATGVVNQVDINLKIENRLGEAGIKIPITTSWNNHNGNDAFSITFAQAANSSAVNSAVMWLDLGSATGVNYTLKFQPFTFTPFSSNTNPGTVALDPSKLTQTTVAGLTTASDWNWTNNANGFAFAWATPSTKSGVATKTINIDFFDINGNQKGLTNSSIIIPASASWGISNDSNYNTGSSYFVFTIDNANSSLNILNKFTFDGSIVTQVLSGGSFTPTSVQLLLDVGSIRKKGTIFFHKKNIINII
jgi:hypothetical protein